MSGENYGPDDAMAWEQADDELTPQETAAIIAFAVILTDTQLNAVLHYFAHEIARRQGVTEPQIMNIPINGGGGMIVLPGGKI